jgi:hypothetical protein
MPYRPITPIKGPGIVAMDALYDEQEDARRADVEGEARSRDADPTRGRRTAMVVGAVLIAAVLVVAAVVVASRSQPGPTPPAVASLAGLAGSAPATTTFDGQRYTIAFTAANPGSVLAVGRTYATSRGYSFDTPSDGMVAFTITGPQGGTALGYFDGGGEANSGIRIVVAASDLTADGTALR